MPLGGCSDPNMQLFHVAVCHVAAVHLSGGEIGLLFA